ncbi:MAG TPA: hypothetical protein VFD63_02625 [Pyrinomonadaceae bacterium]|jgi:hypothetical protein|nr:hypothetical protein [Pyrinomonadaceae bacterium]
MRNAPLLILTCTALLTHYRNISAATGRPQRHNAGRMYIIITPRPDFAFEIELANIGNTPK